MSIQPRARHANRGQGIITPAALQLMAATQRTATVPTFRRYVEDTWLPQHVVEATTRQNYTLTIYRHLFPVFADMLMTDITRPLVRAWVTAMQQAGLGRPTIHSNKALLSVIFTRAVDEELVPAHPCTGVKTPPIPRKPRQIITPGQFERIYHALPNDDMRLFVETDIETGLRFSELTELRLADLEATTGMLTISRAVVEVQPPFHPTGGRFLIKQYPKSGSYRRLKLSSHIVDKLTTHAHTNNLSSSDLLFCIGRQPLPRQRPDRPDPQSLGMTAPDPRGRRHWHGTTSAYTYGCRCIHCRAAMADYRADRRSQGKDHPREPRLLDTDGHNPRNWFRNRVWLPTLELADIPIPVRTHDLRHAHASWLLAGGADLQTVKERLGHADITTTARYLHTLPDTDETAIDALAKIRNQPLAGIGG
jgi:integrase